MSDTVFQKIINREINADIVFEDDQSLAFHDLNPQAPLHVLVIPKRAIARLTDAGDDDGALLGHLMLVARTVAADAGYANAFRLAVNNGEDAGQSVFHLHIHVLAGRVFGWPPG